MRWQGADNGREGFLKRDNWFAVLSILAQHEGERHTDLSSAVFEELSARFPNEEWRGRNGDRSFFRDYAAAWVNMGVLRPFRETGQLIELTTAGVRLVREPAGLVEFFRQYLDQYIETTPISINRKVIWSPFEVIAGALSPYDFLDADRLQELSEGLAKALHPELIDAVPSSQETNRRRFRSYLRLLENADAVVIERHGIAVVDHEYLESMLRPTLQYLVDEVGSGVPLAELDEDARKRVERSRVVREGQKEFSQLVRVAYGDRCCVTGTREVNVLEAAHILPYLGRQSNFVANGLLLAVDIHRLFDRHLIGVHPTSLRIQLSRFVTDSRYSHLAGVKVMTPGRVRDRPMLAALERRYEMFIDEQ